LWDFGNGQTSTLEDPTANYLSTGIYNVSLTITSDLGVTNSITKQITINNKPTAQFTVTDSACVAAPVSIIDASSSTTGSITNWNWSLGDLSFQTGQNITHEYILSGDYTIQLIATTDLGCSDTTSEIINIKPGPIANFIVNNTCVGETVQFTDQTTVAGTLVSNYQWNFGDGNNSILQNPTNIYPLSTTSYNVELITNSVNGCSDTVISNIRIGNKPSAWFNLSTDTICALSVLTLTDSSFAGTGDTISQRNWDFGDGQMDSIDTQVTHYYSSPGIYTISLQVISPSDCDSIATRTIVVIDKPTSQFNFNDTCYGFTNTFTDLSTAPSGAIINDWTWAFGDGDSAFTNNAQHTYINPGNYFTSLVVTSNFGCSDTIIKQVKVFELPSANFTYSKACTDKPIQFNDSSMVVGSSIVSWQWSNSSSGSISTMQNPIYSFPNNFVYDVKLIATSQQGCIDSITKFIIVDQTPDFSVITTDHCEKRSTQFQYVPATGSTTNMAYLWTFGDNTASFLSNPTHQYSSSGTYNVALQVTNLTNTCTNTLIDSIIVYPLPLATFSNTETCIGQPLQLFDQSTISSGNLANWKWTLGVTNSNQQNPTFNLSNSGTYNVKLVVTSSFGCKDSTTGIATINALPIVEFTPSSLFGAPPLIIQFDNLSSQGNYSWEFGDNTTGSNSSEPTHSYLDTGVYVITLTTVDTNGCIDSIKKTIYVQIPYPDLAVKGTSFTNIAGQWNMKAIIANSGNITVNKFKLKAQLEGKSTFVQTFENVNLDPSEINEFNFSTTFADDYNQPSFFCVEVISINDTNDLVEKNNRLCITTSNEFEVVSVYPNPFNDNLYLGINLPSERKIAVTLTDIQGRDLGYEQQYQLSKGFSTVQLPTINLDAAIYLLKVKLGDKEKIIKIIKN
jgi:PKD repeat protein